MPPLLARFKRTWLQHWHTFSAVPVGQRFEEHYTRQQSLDAQRSALYLFCRVLLGVVCVVLGIIFTFIPGPAIAFFVVAGAIFAAHSLKVARLLDRTNVRIEQLWQALRARWQRFRQS
jgi:hypothetical protein